MDPIGLHSIFFPYYGSQYGPSTVWLPIFFCDQQKKKKKSYTFEQQNYIVYDDRILSTITLRNKHQQQ